MPTVDEILRGIETAVASPSWGGKGKPQTVAVDAKEIVHSSSPVRSVLAKIKNKSAFGPVSDQWCTRGPLLSTVVVRG